MILNTDLNQRYATQGRARRQFTLSAPSGLRGNPEETNSTTTHTLANGNENNL